MMRLDARGLSVRRGGRTIIDGIDLSLSGGQFVALIGPNGAGKSTLLATLAGLLRPDAGMVRMDDIALDAIAPRLLARRRAYLPQSPRIDWPISVARLVELGLTPWLPGIGRLPPALAARVAAALHAHDLDGLGERPATSLSGGELARAMLARATVGDPELLIVDEPLTGLDPRHALDGIGRLKAMAAAGRLVIASLHDLTLAARHASHVAALADGRLIAFGPTDRVMTAPLIGRLFGVAARIGGEGEDRLVDLRACRYPVGLGGGAH